LITMTRSKVRQVRLVFRRALRLNGRDAGPCIVLAAGPDGLRVQAQNSQAAVQYHAPGEFPPERICVPFSLLADCEGTNAEPVAVELDRNGSVTAQWTDNQIPQLLRYDSAAGKVPVFPAVPAAMAENDVRLWRALADAMDTTDTDSVRLATNCVQLRSNGAKIVATDGRQLLVQKGFNFSWEGDVLVPRNRLFGCKELASEGPLRIGLSEDWLTLQTGPWTFHLAVSKESRFPKTEDFVQRPDMAIARLQLAPSDAAFLADALQRLPCGEDDLNHAVTVDLNGQVVVRAQANGSRAPTELVLSRSTSSGENLRFVTDRNYLARALKLGFCDVCLYGTESPVQAFGDDRAYIWAPLSQDGAIKPNNKAVRIASDDGQSPPCSTEPSPPIRRVTAMSRSTRPQNPIADENENGNGQPDAAGSLDAIEKAEALRSTLRAALGQISELISALKQQKKTTRSVQSALATLRQLGQVAL